MRVTPVDCLTFMVESQSGEASYFVDLGAYSGNGCCDCKDFKCRREPVVARMHPLQLAAMVTATDVEPDDRYICKHISAARRVLARSIIARVVAVEQPPAPLPTTEYGIKRQNYLAKPDNYWCHACQKEHVVEIHHKFGRVGTLIMDDRWWIAVCRTCHEKIHKNPKWAQEAGYLAQPGQWADQSGGTL